MMRPWQRLHSGLSGVYRQQIRPVMEESATEMDRIFLGNGVA
jgi:hypothetical protein